MKHVSLGQLEVSRIGMGIVARLEENAAATSLELTAEQVARLSAIQPSVGDRYADMSMVGR